jgi:apolipoprotein N-acyltransferase
MAKEDNLVDRSEGGSEVVELRSAWATVGLSALSGVLMALSMPNFNLWPLAWIALVPLLTALFLRPPGPTFLYVLPCTLLWWLAAHIWFPQVLGPVLGWFLVAVGGLFYAGLIELGLSVWRKGPDYLKLLALPVAWTSLEWLRSVAPVTRDWWFILLAQSQWNFPPALQVSSITGWPGLSFTIMLANTGLALLLAHLIRRRRLSGYAVTGVAASALVVVLGQRNGSLQQIAIGRHATKNARPNSTLMPSLPVKRWMGASILILSSGRRTSRVTSPMKRTLNASRVLQPS